MIETTRFELGNGLRFVHNYDEITRLCRRVDGICQERREAR